MFTDNDYIPVISPIGVDDNGNTLNLNADTVAGEVASKMNSEKLIILTDVPGVLKDPNDPKSLIKKIKVDEVDDLIKDGTVKHSLLLEIFTTKGIGTMITL